MFNTRIQKFARAFGDELLAIEKAGVRTGLFLKLPVRFFSAGAEYLRARETANGLFCWVVCFMTQTRHAPMSGSRLRTTQERLGALIPKTIRRDAQGKAIDVVTENCIEGEEVRRILHYLAAFNKAFDKAGVTAWVTLYKEEHERDAILHNISFQELDELFELSSEPVIAMLDDMGEDDDTVDEVIIPY